MGEYTVKRNRTLQAICECGVMLAAAQVLGYLKLFRLPNGGSVTLNMLPIFLVCARWGFGYGMLTSFAFSLLQLLLDGFAGIGWQSVIGDYLAAYTLLGIAGLFRGKKSGYVLGCFAGCAARFLSTWITGATVWAEYMPERFFGMTMTSPWLYSALYNGSYILAGGLLCAIAGVLLKGPLEKLPVYKKKV